MPPRPRVPLEDEETELLQGPAMCCRSRVDTRHSSGVSDPMVPQEPCRRAPTLLRASEAAERPVEDRGLWAREGVGKGLNTVCPRGYRAFFQATLRFSGSLRAILKTCCYCELMHTRGKVVNELENSIEVYCRCN